MNQNHWRRRWGLILAGWLILFGIPLAVGALVALCTGCHLHLHVGERAVYEWPAGKRTPQTQPAPTAREQTIEELLRGELR